MMSVLEWFGYGAMVLLAIIFILAWKDIQP